MINTDMIHIGDLGSDAKPHAKSDLLDSKVKIGTVHTYITWFRDLDEVRIFGKRLGAPTAGVVMLITTYHISGFEVEMWITYQYGSGGGGEGRRRREVKPNFKSKR